MKNKSKGQLSSSSESCNPNQSISSLSKSCSIRDSERSQRSQKLFSARRDNESRVKFQLKKEESKKEAQNDYRKENKKQNKRQNKVSELIPEQKVMNEGLASVIKQKKKLQQKFDLMSSNLTSENIKLKQKIVQLLLYSQKSKSKQNLNSKKISWKSQLPIILLFAIIFILVLFLLDQNRQINQYQEQINRLEQQTHSQYLQTNQYDNQIEGNCKSIIQKHRLQITNYKIKMDQQGLQKMKILQQANKCKKQSNQKQVEIQNLRKELKEQRQKIDALDEQTNKYKLEINQLQIKRDENKVKIDQQKRQINKRQTTNNKKRQKSNYKQYVSETSHHSIRKKINELIICRMKNQKKFKLANFIILIKSGRIYLKIKNKNNQAIFQGYYLAIEKYIDVKKFNYLNWYHLVALALQDLQNYEWRMIQARQIGKYQLVHLILNIEFYK